MADNSGDDPENPHEFELALVLEKEIGIVDEVEEMVKLAKLSTYNKKQLFANLYDLLCCMAFDQITQVEALMPSMELWIKCALYFHEILANLHLKEEARTKLFRHFESIDSWPIGFTAYIAEYSHKSKVPESFTSAHAFTATMSPTSLQTVYFGSLVQQRYLASKRCIGCQCIPYWKEPYELDSGDTLSALLLAMRKSLWPAYCLEKAREAINLLQRNAKKQAAEKKKRDDAATDETADDAPGKKVKAPLVVLTDAEKNAQMLVKKAELLSAMTLDWYPNYWITFIYLGPPAGPAPRRRIAFSGGRYELKESGQLHLHETGSPVGAVKLVASRMDKKRKALEAVAAASGLSYYNSATITGATITGATTTGAIIPSSFPVGWTSSQLHSSQELMSLLSNTSIML